MSISSFTEIKSWAHARQLVKEIYELCRGAEISKDYGFKDQIQRAAVSIMSNIAEGFDSGSNKSFLLFLSYAYRSASEVQSLLYVALDLGYFDQASFEKLNKLATEIKSMIGGFRRYLNGQKKLNLP